MRPDTLKNSKSVKELKVRDLERRRGRHSQGGTDVKIRKTNYEAHYKQDTQPGHGKPKGEPGNSRKQG